MVPLDPKETDKLVPDHVSSSASELKPEEEEKKEEEKEEEKEEAAAEEKEVASVSASGTLFSPHLFFLFTSLHHFPSFSQTSSSLFVESGSGSGSGTGSGDAL